MTPEGKVKAEIKDYLKSLTGCWHFMPFMGGYGVRGIPDIIGCYKGRFFAIEVKSEEGKVSPWQARVLALIAKAGGIALVARGAEEVIYKFDKEFSHGR